MKLTYRIESSQIVPCDPEAACIFVYANASDAEKEDVLRLTGLDPADLEAIWDPDEVPRVESVEGATLVIWKIPGNVSFADQVQFEIVSVGIVVRDGKMILIMPRREPSLTGREFKRVDSIVDCILRLLFQSVRQYQGHLKAIRMISQDLQTKIVKAMENRYLVQMFALGESLVYYHNALEANQTVLAKLHSAPELLQFNAEQLRFLGDIIIENQQASKQAAIYTTVLSGLMDARGTIINNNMNVLLKNLTIINVVFLPLNLIASIGGMSEYSMMTQGVPWVISYGLFSVAMVILGLGTWWWLVRVVERRQNRGGQKPN